jgi:nucleoside-diphosphate-sugar epimerase
MKVAITGADGRIGVILRRHWQSRHDLIAIGNGPDLRVRGEWEERLADADTVVHLAANLHKARSFAVMRDNIEILINVVRAAENTRRFVFASSMWVVHDQTGLGSTGNYYTASKRAGEAIVRGWSDVHGRPAVSLRLGHFGSAVGAVAVEHEMLRIDEASLRWWFDKAMDHDEPTCAIWQATGLSNHL